MEGVEGERKVPPLGARGGWNSVSCPAILGEGVEPNVKHRDITPPTHTHIDT